MRAKTYQELFEEKFQALCKMRRDLQAWQCRLELKRLYPGLFQAVFGRDRRERFMGAMDFHLAEGCAVEEARELVLRHAPELADEVGEASLSEP